MHFLNHNTTLKNNVKSVFKKIWLQTMVKKEYKEKLIKLIEEHIPNAKVYLFGSRATEKQSLHSDIDIAIDTNKKVDKYKIALIRLSINDLNIPIDVDIVDFNSIPEKMRNRIEKERIIWKK